MRILKRDELESIWSLDRSELIEAVYSLSEGQLILNADHREVHGWKPGTVESQSPEVLPCFDRGGSFIGMFDEDRLVGFAAVDANPIGPEKDQRQLKWLYVSKNYRQYGAGTLLLNEAKAIARKMGAAFLYISSTPSKNTVEFYMRHGAVPAQYPDPKLLSLEPKDIHLICPV